VKKIWDINFSSGEGGENEDEIVGVKLTFGREKEGKVRREDGHGKYDVTYTGVACIVSGGQKQGGKGKWGSGRGRGGRELCGMAMGSAGRRGRKSR